MYSNGVVVRSLVCYADEGGQTFSVVTFGNTDREFVDELWTFQVTATAPGDHSLDCSIRGDDEVLSSATRDYTVTQPTDTPTPTPSSTQSMSPSSNATPLGPFTRARLQFNPAHSTKTSVTTDGDAPPSSVENPAEEVYGFCWPPDFVLGTEVTTEGSFTVSDGALRGECHLFGRISSSAVLGGIGVLTGHYDTQFNTVSFHFEATRIIRASIGTDEVARTYTLVVDGPATMIDGSTATDMADFSYACVKTAGGTCGIVSASGTVEFTIELLP